MVRVIDRLGTRASRTLFQQALKSLRRGRLAVTTPDGKRRLYGGELPGHVVEARIEDDAFYARLMSGGEVALGEAYVDGLWDTNDLTGLIATAIENRHYAPRLLRAAGDLSRMSRRGRPFKSSDAEVTAPASTAHGLSNSLGALFLDAGMTYSAGVFEGDNQDLEAAQRHKHELLCRKAGLKPGDRVLEIGCGWGGFAMHAATRHDVSVTAVTHSREQFELATRRVAEAGLKDRVTLQLATYREVTGAYDKVVSIEALPGVGAENFEAFFEACNGVLRPGGCLVLQTVSVPERVFSAPHDGPNWIQKHIQPGELPSLAAIERAINGTRFVISDVRDIAPHAARTVRAWRERFEAELDQVRALGFDERFIRTWRYYLCFAEAAFETRIAGDLQIVMDKV